MNIVKLILLAFPAFLASLLLLVNPAQASLKATPAAVIQKTGCSCANCVQTNLDKLQGKLPMIGA